MLSLTVGSAQSAAGDSSCTMGAGVISEDSGAVLVVAFGCSLYQTADLGVAPYDALSLMMADRLPVPYFGCRVFTDALCAVITFVSGGLIGLGTLICAFGLGPFVQFFSKNFSEKVLRYSPAKK